MQRVCAEIAVNLQDVSQDRKSLVEAGEALVKLAAVLSRTLRQEVDESKHVRGLEIERALMAYRQLHTALRWFQEHQYGALSFELRRHLNDALQRAVLTLDALEEWDERQHAEKGRVGTLRSFAPSRSGS